MDILSIDIGIKNLAYCIINYNLHENKFLIKEWNVINLNKKKWIPDICNQKCTYNLKNNKKCNKQSSYYSLINGEKKEYCKTHAKIINKNNKININELIQKKFELWADDFDYSNNDVREKVKEDVKLVLIGGSEWINNNMTKRGLKKILKNNIKNNIKNLKNE